MMYGSLRDDEGSIQECSPRNDQPSGCVRDPKEKENSTKEDYSIDQLLQSIRPYGPFQRLLTFAMCVLNMPGSMAIYLTYFIAADVPWRCTINATHCSTNYTHSGSDMTRCRWNRSDWEYIDSAKTSLQVYFDVCCSKEWEDYLLTSGLFLGWGVSSLLISHLADRYGRKVVIFVSLLTVVLFGSISVFSPRVEVFIVFRFFLGFGIPGLFHIVYTAMGEFTENTYRPLALNLIQSAGTVSVCLFCLISYFIPDWKVLTSLTTLPFLLVFFLLPLVPESLHWLHARKQVKDIHAVVEKMCYWNNVPIPTNIELQMETRNEEKQPETFNLLKLFQTCRLAKRTVKVLYSWFVIGLLYYSLSLAASDLTGSFHRDFVLMKCVEIPSNLVAAFLCDRLGRKKTIAANVVAASISCLLIAGVPVGKCDIVGIQVSEKKAKVLRLALGILGNFTLNMSFSSFTSWTLELYGTDLRALGMGASNLMVRVGGATSPWIVNALKVINARVPFLVMGSLGLSCGCMMFMLPETRNVALTDVSSHDSEKAAGNSHHNSIAAGVKDIVT